MNCFTKSFCLILFVSIFFIPFGSADCEKSTHLTLQPNSFDAELQPSNYQYPTLKEDDLLAIEEIVIYNDANCTYSPSGLHIKAINPENQNIPFCYIPIPAIEPNSSLVLNLNNSLMAHTGPYSICRIKLDKVGNWKIGLTFQEKEPFIYRDEGGLVIVDGKQYNMQFKVYSKLTFEEIEISKKSISHSALYTIFGTFLGGALSFLGGALLIRIEEQNRKKSAIKALIHEIDKNIKLANYIKDNKNLYVEDGKVIFHDFIILNTERVICSDYIKNVELRGDLFDYYKELKLMNNYIQRMRQIGIPKGANDMVNVIASIEMGKNIQKAEELIKELKKEIGKI